MIITCRLRIILSSKSYRLRNIIIDPGDEWYGFYNVNIILLTHAHFDHIYGLNKILELNPTAFVYTNLIGRDMLMNTKKNLSFFYGEPFLFKYLDRVKLVEDKEIIKSDFELEFQAIFTPGHNDSCITWITNEAIFTGDSFIPGIKVVTNLPGGNKKLAQLSLENIHKFDRDRFIYPGHEVKL